VVGDLIDGKLASLCPGIRTRELYLFSEQITPHNFQRVFPRHRALVAAVMEKCLSVGKRGPLSPKNL
jgi:hypothetical protein